MGNLPETKAARREVGGLFRSYHRPLRQGQKAFDIHSGPKTTHKSSATMDTNIPAIKTNPTPTRTSYQAAKIRRSLA